MSDPLEITDFPYRRKPERITNQFNLESCLVCTTPNHGWGVTVTIKGVPAEVKGSTPLEVYHTLADRLNANGAEGFKPVDVWCNLNILWMSELNNRHHKVRLETLLSFLKTAEPLEFETTTAIKHSPDKWMPLNWGTLELYLCTEDYSWTFFGTLVEATLRNLNPQKSPSLSDRPLYTRYAIAVESLKQDPVYSREDARNWLIDTRREITDPSYTGSPLWSR